LCGRLPYTRSSALTELLRRQPPCSQLRGGGSRPLSRSRPPPPNPDVCASTTQKSAWSAVWELSLLVSRRRASAPRRAAVRPCRSSFARGRAARQWVAG